LAILGLLCSFPAAADVELCNEARLIKYQVAIGFFDPAPGAWVSMGWSIVAPGKCMVVPTGPLTKGAIYLHADYYVPTKDTGNVWVDLIAAGIAADMAGSIVGEFDICTQEKAFEILGDTKCVNRGFRRSGAVELKIGDARSALVELLDQGGWRVTPRRGKPQ